MTIVVGYVETNEGRAAFDKAIEEAQRRDARLVVVSSIKSGSGVLRVSDRDDHPEGLRAAEEKLSASGVAHEIVRMDSGHEAAEDLLDVAAREDAELIVIGLRRRTPVGKLILGSNAQRILLDASCPVLAVKS